MQQVMGTGKGMFWMCWMSFIKTSWVKLTLIGSRLGEILFLYNNDNENEGLNLGAWIPKGQ